MNYPAITVIIPTLNAGVYIEKLLSVLLAQDVNVTEIIVIDSSSDDRTVEIAKGFDVKTIVIPRHKFDHGKTRNLAAKEAKSGILVFMTQDALPSDNTLVRKLTEPLKNPEIAATFGRHIPRGDASPTEFFARHFNYPETGFVKGMEDIEKFGIKTFFSSNVCSAYKKDSFFQAGMFPEDIRANEDMLMTAKLILKGYKIAYVPEAKVIHSHNCSLLMQFERYYNIGSSFKNYGWILHYTRPEKEGMRLIKEQLCFVIKQRKYLWIPYVFMESLTKYLGFKIGLIKG
ncbi:MAG: glycosyltransferase [Nitrospirae bacterium]|jgi:rhamnosyltransferase|nr:glycosyltransferase [Nitrospirota bacterium]